MTYRVFPNKPRGAYFLISFPGAGLIFSVEFLLSVTNFWRVQIALLFSLRSKTSKIKLAKMVQIPLFPLVHLLHRNRNLVHT